MSKLGSYLQYTTSVKNVTLILFKVKVSSSHTQALFTEAYTSVNLPRLQKSIYYLRYIRELEVVDSRARSYVLSFEVNFH